MRPESRLFQVASFAGEGCQGNRHLVWLNPPLSESEARRAWSAEHPDAITVFLFTGPSPRAEFYESGQSILRCGSGTLAAAHVLIRELGMGDISSLDTEDGPLALRQEGEWLGYSARGLPLNESADVELWREIINQPILSCWSVGDERDYCLVELADETAVAKLAVNLDALGKSSQRALIVTARAGAPWDYVLRYFAPQHGKPEDAATGSANLQVADFWRQRLHKNRLRGRQLSSEGGEFLLEFAKDRLWVMGRAVSCDDPQQLVVDESGHLL